MQLHPNLQKVGIVQPLICNFFNNTRRVANLSGDKYPYCVTNTTCMEVTLQCIGHLLNINLVFLATDQIVGKQQERPQQSSGWSWWTETETLSRRKFSNVILVVFSFLPQNCDNQELRVVTSRSGYPKKRTLPLTEDFCLIVSKMRSLCKDEHRKRAFEEHYKHESPLPNGAKLNCSLFVTPSPPGAIKGDRCAFFFLFLGVDLNKKNNISIFDHCCWKELGFTELKIRRTDF